MTTFVLDLNDTELRIGRGGRALVSAPGYAVLADEAVLFGRDAIKQFRVNPRRATNQFWHRLSLDPLPARVGAVASHADLVYRHLRALTAEAEIGPGDELIVAAPATTTNEQLSLLLGITEQIGVRVTGLVDAGLAGTASVDLPDRFVHLDVALHRATATRIENGEALARVGSSEIPELSLSALLDSWMGAVSDRFVRETRFDPLTSADTEQQIYNQIYEWLARGASDAVLAIELKHRASVRRVELASSGLLERAQSLYRVADRALDGAPIVLSHRAAALPGLVDRLAQRGAAVTIATPTALFESVERHSRVIRSDPQALKLVTRLPARGTAARSATRRASPTHVLWNAQAVPIGTGVRLSRAVFGDLPNGFPDDALAIAPQQDDVRLSLAPGSAASIDGAPARDGARLSNGAEIELAGLRFRLIRVIDAL